MPRCITTTVECKAHPPYMPLHTRDERYHVLICSIANHDPNPIIYSTKPLPLSPTKEPATNHVLRHTYRHTDRQASKPSVSHTDARFLTPPDPDPGRNTAHVHVQGMYYSPPAGKTAPRSPPRQRD
jgi:hypothetical protein